MQEITFIYVNNQTTLVHKAIGYIINAFEHGTDFASHVAIQFPYLKGYGPIILEAIGKGVILSDYQKYDNDKLQCRITLSLTDEQYAVVEKKAIEIAEHKYVYSYKACIIGGIANSFSRKFARLIAKLLKADKDEQLNCSETATNLSREVYPDFCKDWAMSQITPYDHYIQTVIDSIENKFVITKVTKYGVIYNK